MLLELLSAYTSVIYFIFILLTEAQPVFLLCYYMALALLLCLVPALFIMGSMEQRSNTTTPNDRSYDDICRNCWGYTPIAVLTLSDDMGANVMTGIWIIAGLGILKKSLWMNAPSWFSTLLYILMGWVSVFIIPIIWRETTPFFSYGIIIGGLFYTIGAVVYAFKKPNILQKSVGFHGLWHIFVLGGALTHLLSHLYYYTNFFS